MQAVLEKLFKIREVFSTHLKALFVTQLQWSLLFLRFWWQFSTSVIEHHERVVDSLVVISKINVTSGALNWRFHCFLSILNATDLNTNQHHCLHHCCSIAPLYVCDCFFSKDLLIRYESKKLQLLLLHFKLYLKIMKRNNSGNTLDNYRVLDDFVNVGDHRHKDSSNHFFKRYNQLNAQ